MTDNSDDVSFDEPLESNDPAEHFADELEAGAQQWRDNLNDVFRCVGDRGWLDTLDPTDVPNPKPLLRIRDSGKPWLERGKAGMVAAPGGTGKTTALLQLAVSVASGTPWLDTFEVPNEAVGPVCVALSETDDRNLQRRLIQIVRHKGIDRDALERLQRNLYAVPLVGRPSTLTQPTMPDWRRQLVEQRLERPSPEVQNALERSVEGYTEFAERFESALGRAGEPWRLIVLDPLQRFGADDVETDQAAATRFVELLERWARREWTDDTDTGPAVLVSHHTRKTANVHPLELVRRQGAARGSSALTDGVRWQANMAWGEYDGRNGTREVVLLDVPKTNIGPRGETIYLDRTGDGLLGKRDALPRNAIRAPGESDDDGNQAGDNNQNDDHNGNSARGL